MIIGAIQHHAGAIQCRYDDTAVGAPLGPFGKQAHAAHGAILDFHFLAPAGGVPAARISQHGTGQPRLARRRPRAFGRIGRIVQAHDAEPASRQTLPEALMHEIHGAVVSAASDAGSSGACQRATWSCSTRTSVPELSSMTISSPSCTSTGTRMTISI